MHISKVLQLAAPVFLATTLSLFSQIALSGDSTSKAPREPIKLYDKSELNPKDPGYSWEGTTLLKNIRVIDGTGTKPKSGQDILIADGKIKIVGKTGSVKVPKGAKVIDGKGLTAMPGLIDAHAHIGGGWRGANANGYVPVEGKWQLLAFLYSGITTVFDTGGVTVIGSDTRDMLNVGAWVGPELKIAGAMFETASVGASGANILIPVNDAGVIGGHLDSYKDVYDIEMVKCHSGTNTQVLRTLVAEAHKRDMRVFCDLWHNNGNPWIAKITHLDGYAHNSFMGVTPTKADAKILKDEGTFVITTSVLWDSFGGHRMKTDPKGYLADVKSNPLIVDVTPPHYLKAHNEGGIEKLLDVHKNLTDGMMADVKSTDEMRKDSIKWTKIMVDEGMLVGLGTDVPYGGIWTGESLHREMEIWVNESKVSPLRTIKAATYDNAKIMKMDDRTGSIKQGLEADLLVVKGNPAKNISDTRNIEYIFSNGKLVDRESLTRQWKP